jgi:hypothetical protein
VFRLRAYPVQPARGWVSVYQHSVCLLIRRGSVFVCRRLSLLNIAQDFLLFCIGVHVFPVKGFIEKFSP